MRFWNRSVYLLAVLVTVSAGADAVKQKPVAADTPDKFAQAVQEIHEQMNPGGRYEFINPDERSRVEADFNAMAAMLQKAGSVEHMTQTEKVQLFNTQEHLNGILTHTDSSRLICEHRAPVGTTIPRTTCQTYGEVEIARRAAKKFLNESSTIGSICTDQKKC
jgi:hypothetical protein